MSSITEHMLAFIEQNNAKLDAIQAQTDVIRKQIQEFGQIDLMNTKIHDLDQQIAQKDAKIHNVKTWLDDRDALPQEQREDYTVFLNRVKNYFLE